MVGSVAASYGTFAAISGRYLYPANPDQSDWVYVAQAKRIGSAKAIQFTGPTGAKAVIARKKVGDAADCFVALSSVCPHLGCSVHWEGHKDRFFCPCHNGTFDSTGRATGGPPEQAKQNLLEFPLEVRNGLVFVKMPVESIAQVSEGLSDRAGHDPCLAPRSDDGKGEA